ncbi:helix-turn-helix domain-containing protein [Burkholderia sp. BCC1998]|uniref:helix-turn-helix domain-containing protein n=1 Tax=Burkholderia sp. BCC1998 TaxID=2817447 RepID=UPI002AB71D1C|nr:helix-turn-helix domain-containing protein [Burkholderia sp. BCC1998]
MKTTVQWLDAVKARLDLPSDYAAAKALGVTRSAVSAYRNGRSVFDEKTCIRAAELLGIDPLEVIASARVESAKDPLTRSVWTHALEIFSEGFRTLVLRANACGAWVPQV